MISELLFLFTSAVLGVFLGAQITEAILFVPYWKALSADEFFELHKTYGKKIHQFYAPLTIVATVIPLITVIYHIVYQTNNQLLLGFLGISTLAFFSTYFLYFKSANQSFAKRAISNIELPLELKKWGNWHWGRVCFECIAFGSSLFLLIK